MVQIPPTTPHSQEDEELEAPVQQIDLASSPLISSEVEEQYGTFDGSQNSPRSDWGLSKSSLFELLTLYIWPQLFKTQITLFTG